MPIFIDERDLDRITTTVLDVGGNNVSGKPKGPLSCCEPTIDARKWTDLPTYWYEICKGEDGQGSGGWVTRCQRRPVSYVKGISHGRAGPPIMGYKVLHKITQSVRTPWPLIWSRLSTGLQVAQKFGLER